MRSTFIVLCGSFGMIRIRIGRFYTIGRIIRQDG